MMRLFAISTVVGAVLLGPVQAATAESGNDLRDIRIGRAVTELPASGYVDFACAGDAPQKLSGWTDWRQCAARADGLRALRFGFDPATSANGTMVAGHPALLTALIDDSGVIAGLQIETDPKARFYLRKKAFLFGPQVQARYGQGGWSCSQAKPGSDEEPVGQVYVKETCSKTVDGRSVRIERSLFRKAGQDARGFVDETKVTILRAPS